MAAPPPEDPTDRPSGLTRRRFLEGSALVPIVFVVGACGGDEQAGPATGSAPSQNERPRPANKQ